MDENWMALYLSTITNLSVDKALMAMDICTQRSTHRGSSKATVDMVQKMVDMRSSGCQIKEISRALGVSDGHVSKCLKRAGYIHKKRQYH